MFLIKCFYIIKSLLSFNKNNYIFRLFFTLYYFYKYHIVLKKSLIHTYNNHGLNPQGQVLTEFNIDKLILLNLDNLKSKGFKVLILDYDGVLGSYGDIEPLVEVITWLEKAILVFGANKIFILSNNPSLVRKEFFDKHFNSKIIFVISKPKPYTDGIDYIKKYLLQEFKNIPLDFEILLVDDRIATGILAAKIAGIASCLISKPYINLKKKFIMEILFIILRKLERLILCHL